jgi:hypothetical protein
MNDYSAGSSPGRTFGTINQVGANVPRKDLNAWVHVAGVYDGTKWLLYRNGAVLARNNAPKGAWPLACNWAIGAETAPAPCRFFKGGIADVRIYNVALTNAEIAKIVKGTSGSTPPLNR